MVEAASTANPKMTTGNRPPEPGELWIDSVPADRRRAVAHWLVGHLDYRLPDAWTILDRLPMPCVLAPPSTRAEFAVALEEFGAALSERGLPSDRPGERCATHPVAAVTVCRRCQKPRCRLCARDASPVHCPSCVEAIQDGGSRRAIGLFAVLVLLGAGYMPLRDFIEAFIVSEIESEDSDTPIATSRRTAVDVRSAPGPVTDSESASPTAAPVAVEPSPPAVAAPTPAPSPSPTPDEPDRAPMPDRVGSLRTARSLARNRRYEAAHAALRDLAAPGPRRRTDAPWAQVVGEAAARAPHEWRVRFLDLGLTHHYGDERDELLVARAALHAESGRLDAAILDLRGVSPMASSVRAAKLALGVALHRRGDVDEALATWRDLARRSGPEAEQARA